MLSVLGVVAGLHVGYPCVQVSFLISNRAERGLHLLCALHDTDLMALKALLLLLERELGQAASGIN